MAVTRSVTLATWPERAPGAHDREEHLDRFSHDLKVGEVQLGAQVLGQPTRTTCGGWRSRRRPRAAAGPVDTVDLLEESVLRAIATRRPSALDHLVISSTAPRSCCTRCTSAADPATARPRNSGSTAVRRVNQDAHNAWCPRACYAWRSRCLTMPKKSFRPKPTRSQASSALTPKLKSIRWRWSAVLIAMAGTVVLGYLAVTSRAAVPPPPAGGYFRFLAAGQFASLPDDAQAASMVHRSPWEPRPENAAANQTVPRGFTTGGYSGMENHAQLFGRVTGNFTGTTDEIIQWAAVKWGVPDDVIRAEAVVESFWYQGLKHQDGTPVEGHGYGDFGDCGGSPEPSGYRSGGPASFGLMQIKWCAMKDASAASYDGWPWSERSTSYNLDLYGAVLRGCIEGWDSWLGNGYHAGDLWGCIGRWFAGQWYSDDAQEYINVVKTNLVNKPWRSWLDRS
jgi:hypothetical protein